jgi:hypothetical protein
MNDQVTRQDTEKARLELQIFGGRFMIRTFIIENGSRSGPSDLRETLECLVGGNREALMAGTRAFGGAASPLD